MEEQELIAFIREGRGSFEELALRLFAYQFERNMPYRQLCLRMRRTPATVRDWREIPPVPVQAFKEAELRCEERVAAVFMTSGTTQGERRGRNFHASLDLWDASMETFFALHVLRGLWPDVRPAVLVLGLSFSANPHSSFSRYFDRAVATFGGPGSGFFATPAGLDVEGLHRALRQCQEAGRPAVLVGPTFAFVHWFDGCSDHFQLPPGSRLVDGGGTKGQSREVQPEELYRRAGEVLGIGLEACINEYGATELSSQAYDRLGPEDDPAVFPRVKVNPPWMRTRVLDPETLEEVPPGTQGLLCHYDLANRNAVLAVLTEDLGFAPDRSGHHWVFVGRARGSEARGCSLAMDEWLSGLAPVVQS